MRLCGEALEVVHEPRAAVFGVLVVATDVNRLFRAHLLTIAAEDASELVDLVDEGVAIPFLVFTGNELDAIRRTDLRTEPARHALRLSGFVGEHAVRAAPPPRDRLFLLRILRRHLVRIHEVLERQRHTLERRANVAHLFRGPGHDLHADRHQSAPGVASGERDRMARRRRSCSASTRPEAGLMMRPLSRMRNRMPVSTRFRTPRMRPYNAPGRMPSRSRIRSAPAMSTMYTSATGSSTRQPSDIN